MGLLKEMTLCRGSYEGRPVVYYVRDCSARCGQVVIVYPDTLIAVGVLPGVEWLDNYRESRHDSN